MENVRITKNSDGETYTFTILNDSSHGDRTFTLCKEDLNKIVEILQ
jgi:hypothetical protein